MVPPSTVACALLPSALLTPRAKRLPNEPIRFSPDFRSTHARRAKLRQLTDQVAFRACWLPFKGSATPAGGPAQTIRDLEMEYFTDGPVYTRIGPRAYVTRRTVRTGRSQPMTGIP